MGVPRVQPSHVACVRVRTSGGAGGSSLPCVRSPLRGTSANASGTPVSSARLTGLAADVWAEWAEHVYGAGSVPP